MMKTRTAVSIATSLMTVFIALAPACYGKSLGLGPESVSSRNGLSLRLGYTLDVQGETQESSIAAFEPCKTYTVEALKEDLEILWAILEEGHGGLDRYTAIGELKKSFDAAGNGLTGPLTELDFYSRLLPLVAGIKDGHTRLMLSPAAAAELDAQPVFFPFGLRFLNDKAYVFWNLSPDESIKEGAELLAIDGTPIVDVVAALLPLIPSDAGIRTSPAPAPRVSGGFWPAPGPSVRTAGIPPRPLPAVPGRGDQGGWDPGYHGGRHHPAPPERYPAAAERRPAYELSFQGPAAVLTIRGFADDPDTARPRYPEFLKETFRSLEEKKIPNLIIDLRGAGGGRDEYAKLLFAHVMDRPFFYYWALETKKDRYDLFRFTDESAAGAEELARPLRKNARGWFDVLGHPNGGLQMPRVPRFAGRVAILIDGGSFSATGEAVSAFHYHKKAVFFGEECGSGYYGSTSGFTVTATLPNTRIQVRIPLVICAMAVDGYPKDRGLVPDFPVTPTIEDLLAGRDPVKERALRFLEKGE